MCTPPPENVGSGKFGTPCVRMHAAAFRYCDCSEGVIWWFEPAPGPPPGSSLLQACCADLNWGLPVIAGVTLDRHLYFVAVGGDLRVGEVGHAVRAHARRVRHSLAVG